ncbi:MAG: DUF131 domain-containing protein [Candidatus Thorarchaeota archaeon]|nr:DUF131 domain-containing protein [Candidatus Thorarchaeota archaeon]
MQTGTMLTLIGVALILIGVALILAGLMIESRSSHDRTGDSQTSSRGVVLIGPIPIIWGFGPRGKVIAVIAFAAVVLLWLLLLL